MPDGSRFFCDKCNDYASAVIPRFVIIFINNVR